MSDLGAAILCERSLELIKAQLDYFLALSFDEFSTNLGRLAQRRRAKEEYNWADELLIAKIVTSIISFQNLIDQHSCDPRHLLLNFNSDRE